MGALFVGYGDKSPNGYKTKSVKREKNENEIQQDLIILQNIERYKKLLRW